MSLTMEALSRHRTLILCAAAFGASVAVGWFLCASKKKSKKRKLQKVGEVSQLFIHPIKSMRGVSLSEAECEEFGLKNGNLKDRVWGNEVPGRDCGEDASHWITNFLKAKQVYRLMHFENKMKPRNPKNEYPTYTENDQVAYPDLSPLLLLSEASLDDLNTKLQKKVTIRHFRPNIVITGCSAFEEDSWKEMQIGNHVTLKQVMPCPRCILTTVDPDTGVIDMKEPLETLRSYRLCDTADKEVYKDSPLFGHFLRIEKNGKIKVGDPVYQITY
ncbi:mitochondrial amidoxime reducing component 2 isoform X2 [Bombina bombina]|uniref:mitochondrial amidoxime reducing component 2 isoform X2 n=1 Tax=Bombina bombina TaxID=8345 RepID=UPI00235A7D5F|nr:mitochondrial amidoxime reducing component 2 isoform X2 [Bombina bombina]